MKLLYLGDVMAAPGVSVVQKYLRGLRNEYGVDFVVAQAENVTEGRGMSVADYQTLRAAGVDCFSGGNWSLYREELIPLLADPNAPVVRPANYPADTPGRGYKYVDSARGRVLVVSLLGKIVGKDAEKPVDNPLLYIDALLEQESQQERVATIVNFHGDFSSEKVVIGHYLDGRASLVIGDHWHVPTADARVLPGGTAHMTDAGMCGVLNSSLGVEYDSIIPRWRDGKPTRNIMADGGALQLSGLLVEVDASGKALSSEHIYRIYD
ncbi:metallophosphoesterase [Candidatus Saccharibacteria bacterium]|nr:MAG: metallophosphoesterase [Candidatus Saccharibacteria bacterium]